MWQYEGVRLEPLQLGHSENINRAYSKFGTCEDQLRHGGHLTISTIL